MPDNWNTNSFDDSSWSRAVSYGRNNDAGTAFYHKLNGYALGIPGNARWIWAPNNANHKLVVCRSATVCLCLLSFVAQLACVYPPAPFAGIILRFSPKHEPSTCGAQPRPLQQAV